jgi:hypothetical protein
MPRPRTNLAIIRKIRFGAKAEASAPITITIATVMYTFLRPEDVGDSTESECPDERPENGRAGDPTRLGRREIPLELEDRGDRADHEEVVRVGKKTPYPR